MSLFASDDPELLERAAELYETMHQDRLIPEVDPSSTQDELWGELRSLCAQSMTGAELWSEWRTLFALFEPSQHEALFAYMDDRFRLPVHDILSLERAFLYEVIRLDVASMRQEKIEVMKPALGEAAMKDWEEGAGVKVSEPLRTFVVEVSAGYELDGEFGAFDFENLDPGHHVFGHLLEEMHQEEEEEGRHAWELDMLAGALEYFATHPDASECDIAQAQKSRKQVEERDRSSIERSEIERASLSLSRESEQARQLVPESNHDLQQALVVGWYFEGNHGDYTDLLITRGPLAGELVRFDSMVHTGRDLAGVRFHRLDVMRWLYERYYEDCLSEEVWGECEELLELF